MRVILVFLTAVFLSACNIEKLAEKILPETVLADSQTAVDSVMAGNTAHFAPLKSEEMSQEEFDDRLLRLFDERSSGEEVSRHIVSASSSSNYGTNGNSKDIQLIYEIKTTEGYSAIGLSYALAPATGECCTLTRVTVQQSETSPYYEGMLVMMKSLKIAGLMLLLFGAGLFIFLRRRKKKKASV